MSYQVESYHSSDIFSNPPENNFSVNGNGNGRGHQAPAAVDSQDLDSSYLGVARIPEYFSIFWTPIVGAKAALLYVLIFTHCYGEKTSCFPSLEMLAAILGFDRHTLKGRERTNKKTGEKYYKAGLLGVLLRHGLIKMSKRGKSYQYELIKVLPMLTPEQLNALPVILRARHEKDVKRIRTNQEKQQEKDKKHQEKEQADMVRFSPDMVRQGHRHMVRQGHHESDKETDNKNLSEKAEREVVKNKEKTGAEKTDFRAAIYSFYQRQGDEISSNRVDIEIRKITPLRSEYTDGQIMDAISWVSNNLNKFSGGVHSIGGLLPRIIDKALAEAEKERKRIWQSGEALRERIRWETSPEYNNNGNGKSLSEYVEAERERAQATMT